MKSVSKSIINEQLLTSEPYIKLINIKNLFNDVYTKKEEIEYKTVVLDPFLNINKPKDGQYNLDNLYDWYLTKNTNFQAEGRTMRDVNPSIPEFKTVLGNMLKDLLILCITGYFPDKNNLEPVEPTQMFDNCNDITQLYGTKIENLNDVDILLQELDTIIKNNYKYVSIIGFIKKYLQLFNFGNIADDGIPAGDCKISLDRMDELLDTFYLVYPCFSFVSYTKILYFLQAPVLLLKMGNIRELTDKVWMSPITQIAHDIGDQGHTDYTHCVNKEDVHVSKNLFQNKDEIYDKYKKKFNIMKEYINVNYKVLDANINNNSNSNGKNKQDNERIKYIISFMLFYIIHEQVPRLPGYVKCGFAKILYHEHMKNLLITRNMFDTDYTFHRLRENFPDIEEPNENTQKELKRFFLQGDQKIKTDINLQIKSSNYLQIKKSNSVVIQKLTEMFGKFDLIDNQSVQNAGGNKYKKQYNKTKNNKYKCKRTKKTIKHLL